MAAFYTLVSAEGLLEGGMSMGTCRLGLAIVVPP